MQYSFDQLLEKHLTGSLDPGEKAAFLQMLEDAAHLQALEAVIDRHAKDKTLLITEDAVLKRVSFERLKGSLPRVRPLRTWGWAAASVVLLLAVGAYWLSSSRSERTADQTAQTIAPGKEGAILTLSDGSTVVLDSLGNGLVAAQNGVNVMLLDGQLVYDPATQKEGMLAYNTMRTPKGRQFRLTLPDGTKVWLNAASVLRYPTAFSGKNRVVELTGEAYFEVAQHSAKPFRVMANGQTEIHVLGTDFNVQAYENEAIVSTTLLKGSVRVNNIVLQPGQQAQAPRGEGDIRLVKNADIGRVMAWKNGLFDFTDVPLADVMRQLERWYDIEVVYEKGVPDIELKGKMSKDISLADLMVILEKVGVHYRLEGRRLHVLP